MTCWKATWFTPSPAAGRATPAQALVASDEGAAQALEDFGAMELRQSKVVDPYLVDVQVGDGGLPVPRHYREVLRMHGPSVRRDLGKQADFNF